MRVIITNDDFAATYGFTEAIKQSYLNGITTSTSIEINGPAFNYAIQLLKTSLKGIGLNLHLNINHGKGFSPKLLDKDGNYKYSIYYYYLFYPTLDHKFLQAIYDDFDMQIKTVLNKNLTPICLNGHNHIHLVPPIFEITCQLAKKYNIKYIRLPYEPLYYSGDVRTSLYALLNKNLARYFMTYFFYKLNRAKLIKFGLKSTQAFYGILYSNYMNQATIKSSLNDALNKKFTNLEILGHPAIKDKRDTKYTCTFMSKYSQLEERQIEAKTFKNSDILKFMKDNNITPSTFNNI